MSDNVTQSGGIGICGLLGVALIVLKLMHYIDWSWWWVTVPFWGPLTFWVAVLFLGFIIFCIFGD